nr:integrase, catalytic core [Tanacetum cinerariifolium]
STVNTAGTYEVNDVGENISIELQFYPNMPALEDVSTFDFSRDDENDGVVADMNNLDTTIQVIPIPSTRIHKDHPLDQVIGDLQSATQTRKMLKNLEEHSNSALKSVITSLQQGNSKNSRYTWSANKLRRKGKLVVGNDEQLRLKLISHFNDSPNGGHSGV